MANQGFPYEGSDTRTFAFLAPLARCLCWNTAKVPPRLHLSFAELRVFIPLWMIPYKFPKPGAYVLFRIGWHYDFNATDAAGNGAYIPGATLKVVSELSY